LELRVRKGPIVAARALSIPAAPGSLPLLGHALSFARDPVAFIASLGSLDPGLVQVRVGTSSLYFVTAHEAAYEILVAQARSFDKGRMYRQTRSLVGDGLVTSEGDLHRRQRRLMQ